MLSDTVASALGVGLGELGVLRYLATHQISPEGWVDLQPDAAAGQLGTSRANIKRALYRLAAMGLVEHRRPRSSLWRLAPGVLRRLHEGR